MLFFFKNQNDVYDTYKVRLLNFLEGQLSVDLWRTNDKVSDFSDNWRTLIKLEKLRTPKLEIVC